MILVATAEGNIQPAHFFYTGSHYHFVYLELQEDIHLVQR